ncbi:MAG: FAD-dependent oxidoreductase [Burkholderiaceae bacterium]|nr:FAD-dependent oxidoreductase [Burkholderiaceae bacterium]
MQIAIIGAGISGLACARQLCALGHQVTLFEKGGEAGGRVHTWQTEIGGFDLGAQFFTAISDNFKKAVSSWRKDGLVMPWHGRLVSLRDGIVAPARSSSQRFVAAPGMAELARHLARGLDIRTGQTVVRIEAGLLPGNWRLALKADGKKTLTEPFDAVVVATPGDQAAGLLAPVPALAGKAELTGHVSCWALMLGFEQPLNLEFDGAWVKHHRLAWVARDDSKPERGDGERWIVLARVEWSAEHLKDGPARVRDKLLKAFQEATGTSVQPVYSVARLWNYAQSTRPLAKSCLWDEKQRIGACGDWFSAGLEGGGQIEHAYLSGMMLAARIDEAAKPILVKPVRAAANTTDRAPAVKPAIGRRRTGAASSR